MTRMNKIGLALLALAFGSSLLKRASREPVFSGDRKVITLCHWQLEGGWREGFDAVFREYEELHPGVEIRQIPVSGHYYAPWITTQLLGGTAPDLVQIEREPPEYLPRYYVDLTPYINEPNPYNRGSSLEGMAWHNSMVDGMQAGYRPAYLAYYGVPLSVFVFRVYYNKDIFRAALGHDRPPGDFREWIEYCRKIKAWGEKQPKKVIPVAAIGKWTNDVLLSVYMTSTTSDLLDLLDCNHNGRTGTGFGTGSFGEPVESFFGVFSGKISLSDPHVRTAFDMVADVKRYFQSGFVATSWDDGKFLFVQGDAAMMPTGSWETKSFFQTAKFEIGGFPFPIPGKDDPEYGKYIAGPVSEVGIPGGATYGIPKQTKHLEVAIDLLRFLSSKRLNERFMNEYTLWPPNVRDAETVEALKPFRPEGEGYRGGFTLGGLGPETKGEYGRQVSLWLNDEKTLDEFFGEYSDFYARRAPFDVETSQLMPARRNVSDMERQVNLLQFERVSGVSRDAEVLRREAYVAECQLNATYELAFGEHMTRKLTERKPRP